MKIRNLKRKRKRGNLGISVQKEGHQVGTSGILTNNHINGKMVGQSCRVRGRRNEKRRLTKQM